MTSLSINYTNVIKSFELSVAYMYVDTTGNVTVGIGHNLTAHRDHTRLAFRVQRLARHPVVGGDAGIPITTNPRIGRAATTQEIQNDFEFLTKHKGLGKYSVKQGTMQKYTTLELDATAINTLFEADLNTATNSVKAIFSNYGTFPAPCCAALIDLQFNTGKLANGFPKLVEAIKGIGQHQGKPMSERWLVAANESKRGQVESVRNDQIRKWFKEGAEIAKNQ